MVYQIYYGMERPGETLFDIEYYLKIDERDPDSDEKWMVELHCISFISGAVNFIFDTLRKERKDEFIKDCKELEDLRGWLWETHRNYPRTLEDAQKDMKDWREYLEMKLRGFCNKYHLYLNID